MALQRPNRGLLLALVATILCICCHTSHAATEKSAVRSSADLTNLHAPSLDGLYGGSDDDDPDEETLQAQIKVDKALMETGDNSMEQELSELIASSEIGLHSAKSSRTAKKDSMKQKPKGNAGKDSVTANIKTLDEQLNDDVKALMGISDKEVQKVDTNLQQLSAQLDFGGQAFGVPSSSAGGDILLELDSVAPRYNRKVAPELPNPYPFPEELAPEAEEAKLASLLTVTITEPDPVFPGRFRKRTIPLSQLNPNQTISLAPSAAMANNSLVAGAVNSTQHQQPPLPPPPLPSYIPPWTPGVSNLTREERVLLAQSFEEIASTPTRPGAQPLVTRGELAAGNHTWLSLEAEEARQAVVAKDEIVANKTSSLLMEHFEEAPFEVRQCLSRPAGCSCFRCCNMLCAAWRSSLHTRDEKKAHRHCVKTCFFNANAEPEGTTKQWPSLCRKCHVKSRYRLLLEQSLNRRVNETVVASNSTQGANSTQTQLQAPAQAAPSVKIV